MAKLNYSFSPPRKPKRTSKVLVNIKIISKVDNSNFLASQGYILEYIQMYFIYF